MCMFHCPRVKMLEKSEGHNSKVHQGPDYMHLQNLLQGSKTAALKVCFLKAKSVAENYLKCKVILLILYISVLYIL